MEFLERNYGFFDPHDADRTYHKPEGQYMAGVSIGIIQLTCRVLFFPGNVSNATTYSFPVRYLPVEGTDQGNIHAGDKSLVPLLVKAAKQLELDGCRAIFANCGYYGHFQKDVSEAVDVPVYLSACVQIPWIFAGLKKNQKIAVLCGDAPNLSWDLFEACGCTREQYERCVIVGMEDCPEFRNILDDTGSMNCAAVGREVVEKTRKALEADPEIGAILLECTDLPPYAAQLQNAFNLPVFDAITLINYIHNAVCQKPYYGYM